MVLTNNGHTHRREDVSIFGLSLNKEPPKMGGFPLVSLGLKNDRKDAHKETQFV